MNEILAYYQAIEDGSEVVGRWIRIWYKHIVNGLEQGLFFFSPKKAKAAIRFIENFCRHHEGAWAPNLIKLELWQRALISVLFGIVDNTGARQFREAFVVIARKNGKTLLAAAISAYCAVLDGEYGARVYFAAPKLAQASLCYDAFTQMIYKEPELARITRKRRSDIYFPDTNTTVQPLAFNAKKSDGLNISLCVADEVASWVGDAGLKMYEVLRSSFGARRQPLLLSISTAGYANDGVYDELMRRSTAVLRGSSKETRLAPFLYIIDDTAKWNDLNELKKSNPNLGVSISVDFMLEEIAIAESSLPKRAEFFTKYCNVKQSSSVAWLEFQAVEKCLGEIDLEKLRHHYCVAGVDLSRVADLTSACLLIEDQGRLYVISHFWMPTARIDIATDEDGVPYRQMVERGFLSLSGDQFVEYEDVFQWFRQWVEEYEILPLMTGFDRWSSTYWCDEMKKYGFHLDDVKQGFNLTPCIRDLDAMIKNGALCIGDNTLLQAHMLNSALKTEEDKCRLVKITQRARIDGMAALLDAVTVRQKHYPDIGAQLKNEG